MLTTGVRRQDETNVVFVSRRNEANAVNHIRLRHGFKAKGRHSVRGAYLRAVSEHNVVAHQSTIIPVYYARRRKLTPRDGQRVASTVMPASSMRVELLYLHN